MFEVKTMLPRIKKSEKQREARKWKKENPTDSLSIPYPFPGFSQFSHIVQRVPF